VFKKDLRIRKLFAYLKYLNGKKILVRDLAWHFAVTERTIQHDLRWLENNGFITTQKNKTRKGIQTKNSYLVNTDKENDLPFENTYLAVCFIAKQNDDYYVLTKTNYVPQEQNFKKFKPMKDCNFNLPQVKLGVEKRLDDKSLNMAKKLFENDLSKYYKGYIYSGYYNKKILHHSDIDYDDIIITNRRTRLMFSWFLLDDLAVVSTGYMWIKLDSSNRKIDNTITNKCLNKIQTILGVK
jgi:hypothetical protein